MASPPANRALRELHEDLGPMLCLDGVLLCDRLTPPLEWQLLVRRIHERVHTHHVCGWEHEGFRSVCETVHRSSSVSAFWLVSRVLAEIYT